ncbi:MAG: hypothetical protein WKF75_16335 [Singulisphaera sp.]
MAVYLDRRDAACGWAGMSPAPPPEAVTVAPGRASAIVAGAPRAPRHDRLWRAAPGVNGAGVPQPTAFGASRNFDGQRCVIWRK